MAPQRKQDSQRQMVGVFQNALERTGIKENDRRPEKSSAGVEVAGAVGRPTPYQARNPGRPAPQGGSTQIRFLLPFVLSPASFTCCLPDELLLKDPGVQKLAILLSSRKKLSARPPPPGEGLGYFPQGKIFSGAANRGGNAFLMCVFWQGLVLYQTEAQKSPKMGISVWGGVSGTLHR